MKVKEQFSIVDLLPQDENAKMIDPQMPVRILKIIYFNLQHLKEALQEFINQNYASFDAQVGETSCQIRAYKIYQLAKRGSLQKSKFNALLQFIMGHIFKVKNLLKRRLELSDKKYDKKCQILSEFLLENDLFLSFDFDAVFLLFSYILCKYHVVNEDGIPIGINKNLIIDCMGVSRNMTTNLINLYQKKLSEMSCGYILNLANEIKYSKESCIYLESLIKKDDMGRLALPCFDITKIILLHSIKSSSKILIKLNKKFKQEKKLINLLYIASFDTCFNILKKITNHVFFPQVLVFQGEMECENFKVFEEDDILFNKFSKISLKDLVLANNAMHPQFSGKLLEKYRDNPYFSDLEVDSNFEKSRLDSELTKLIDIKEKDFLHYRNVAKNLGCHQNARKLFFLRHIYCDNIFNYRVN